MTSSKKRYLIRIAVFAIALESIIICVKHYGNLFNTLKSLKILARSEYLTAVIGIIGVLIGVFLSELYRRLSERNKKRRELLSQYNDIVNDYLAHIKKVERAKLENNFQSLDELKLQEYKFCSQINNLLFKTWDVYNDLWLRTATNRLSCTFKIISDTVYNDQKQVPKLFFICETWLNNQMDELYDLLRKGAGIENRTGGHPVFVGWRKVTVQDKEKLKFEISVPPWEPNLELDIRKKISSKDKENVLRTNYDKIKNVRCTKHGYAPHIVFNGKSLNNFDITVLGCCNELVEETMRHIYNKS